MEKITKCGKHLMDSFATLDLIHKIDEYQKDGKEITSTQEGGNIHVCVSGNENEVEEIVNELESNKFQVDFGDYYKKKGNIEWTK